MTCQPRTHLKKYSPSFQQLQQQQLWSLPQRPQLQPPPPQRLMVGQPAAHGTRPSLFYIHCIYLYHMTCPNQNFYIYKPPLGTMQAVEIVSGVTLPSHNAPVAVEPGWNLTPTASL